MEDVKKYSIVFTNFDTNYEDAEIVRDSKKQIIEIADKIIRSVTNDKFSLLSELNQMSQEALYSLDKTSFIKEEQNKICFYDLYSIPFYFINLLLKQYNMKIEEKKQKRVFKHKQVENQKSNKNEKH